MRLSRIADGPVASPLSPIPSHPLATHLAVILSPPLATDLAGTSPGKSLFPIVSPPLAADLAGLVPAIHESRRPLCANERERVPPFARMARLRDPDAITGGTWKALHRLLKRHGSYPEVFSKIEVARRIAPHLDVNTNHSARFRTFCGGVEALLASAMTASGRQTDQPTL